jgi:hypothetical protein
VYWGQYTPCTGVSIHRVLGSVPIVVHPPSRRNRRRSAAYSRSLHGVSRARSGAEMCVRDAHAVQDAQHPASGMHSTLPPGCRMHSLLYSILPSGCTAPCLQDAGCTAGQHPAAHPAPRMHSILPPGRTLLDSILLELDSILSSRVQQGTAGQHPAVHPAPRMHSILPSGRTASCTASTASRLRSGRSGWGKRSRRPDVATHHQLVMVRSSAHHQPIVPSFPDACYAGGFAPVTLSR